MFPLECSGTNNPLAKTLREKRSYILLPSIKIVPV